MGRARDRCGTGLTAATFLARCRRRVLVLDGGRTRAESIPESHNLPGFPRGVGGPSLLARLREQAAIFGAGKQEGWVETLEVTALGFVARGTTGELAAPVDKTLQSARRSFVAVAGVNGPEQSKKGPKGRR